MSHATSGFVFLIFVLLSLCVNDSTGVIDSKVVVCYVGTWAVYRTQRGSFDLSNIDPNLCTHVVYAFAGLDVPNSAIKSLDAWQDLKDDYGKGGYERATGMKSKYPHLKVTLAIGGWTEGSQKYSEMAADPEKRKKFVSSVVLFLKKYNFDGLDLDWEYPAKRGGKPEDKKNFVYLVKELKEALEPHNMILTSAIGASKETIDNGYDVPEISKYLDLLHIMCYDLHGAWDMRTGANAPLHSKSSDNLSVEFTMKYLLSLGAPANKLVLGVPFYGRTFIKTPPFDPIQDIGAPTKSTGFKGPITKEDGFMGYNEVCLILSNKTSGWRQHWDEESKTPYFVNEDKVVTYDDQKSIIEKVRFALDNNFGGVMIWSIDTDDFHGDCSLEMDNIYESFTQELAELKSTPGFKQAVPILEQRLNTSKLSQVEFTAYEVRSGDINIVLPVRRLSSYPLLRSLNEALAIGNEAKIIRREIHKIFKEFEKDNEISGSSKKHQTNMASAWHTSKFLSAFIFVIVYRLL